MNLDQIKKLLQTNKAFIEEHFHVKEIGIFGSYIQKREKPGSDIDILVSFEKSHKDFFNYIRLKYFLEELFKLEVDLVMKDAVKPGLKQRILSEVEYV
jgi:predicted nucleotidyltransferase